MKKITTTTLLIITICNSIFAQALLDKTNWYLFKSDEFNYTNKTTLFQNWNNGFPWPQPCYTGHTGQQFYEDIVCADVPENLVLDGNCLHLKSGLLADPFPCNNNTYAIFGSASITSKIKDETECPDSGFVYGMFEARIKMGNGNGMYGAFWLTGLSWPPELDVFEYNGRTPNEFFSTPHWMAPTYYGNLVNCSNSLSLSIGNKVFTIPPGWTIEPGQGIILKIDNTHYMSGSVNSYNNTSGLTNVNINSVVGSGTYNSWKVNCSENNCSSSIFVDKLGNIDLSAEFHTYSCVWTPNEVTWFFDGKEYMRDTRPIRVPQKDCTNSNKKMVISLGLSPNWIDNINQSSEMLVDYVRIYKPISSNTTWNHFQNNYKTIDNTAHMLYSTEPSNTAQSKMFVTNTGNVFYRGADFRLWNYYWNGTSFATAPINWNVTDVSEDITNDLINSKIYYRSTSNTLKYFLGTSSFQTTSATTCEGFLTLDQYSGVYYRGSNNYLYYCKPNNVGVYTNSKILNINNVGGKICYNQSTNTIFYKGTDNNIWSTQYNNTSNTWSNPTKRTFTNNVTDHVIWATDRLFYAGIDKKIYNFYFDGSSWKNAPLSFASEDANCLGELAIDQSGGRNLLYYKGVDGRLWYCYTDNGWGLTYGGQWYNSSTDNISQVGGPIIVRNDGNVYYRGTDSKVYENWFQTSTKTNLGTNNTSSNNNIVFKTGEVNGLSDESLLPTNTFELYPNPVEGILNFSFSSSKTNVCLVRILDVTGRVLYEKKFDCQSGYNNSSIDISSFEKGSYLFELSNDDNDYKRKFQKR